MWAAASGAFSRQAQAVRLYYPFAECVVAGRARLLTMVAVTVTPRRSNFLFHIPNKTLKRYAKEQRTLHRHVAPPTATLAPGRARAATTIKGRLNNVVVTEAIDPHKCVRFLASTTDLRDIRREQKTI